MYCSVPSQVFSLQTWFSGDIVQFVLLRLWWTVGSRTRSRVAMMSCIVVGDKNISSLAAVAVD